LSYSDYKIKHIVKYAFGSKTKKEENCALDIKKHGKKITALFLQLVFV
jgi:hypothetical protein